MVLEVFHLKDNQLVLFRVQGLRLVSQLQLFKYIQVIARNVYHFVSERIHIDY